MKASQQCCMHIVGLHTHVELKVSLLASSSDPQKGYSEACMKTTVLCAYYPASAHEHAWLLVAYMDWYTSRQKDAQATMLCDSNCSMLKHLHMCFPALHWCLQKLCVRFKRTLTWPADPACELVSGLTKTIHRTPLCRVPLLSRQHAKAASFSSDVSAGTHVLMWLFWCRSLQLHCTLSCVIKPTWYFSRACPTLGYMVTSDKRQWVRHNVSTNAHSGRTQF